MKKLSLLIGFLFLAMVSFASQRIVMVEEFTQASCPPCASQNPAFNTLLNANPTKVIALKYQTSWPGVDPMNAQTQTWVGNRVSYYAVSGVPYSLHDGAAFTGANYVGAPANATQAIINTAYAVPSSFDMSLSHSFNATLDSVYISLTITCNQDFTGTTMKCRVALTENQVDFCTAPGTNGETEFSEVTRAMYPDANGTTIANTWTSGQTQTITFAKALPSYLYDKNEIAVVAFIQDDGNKVINQAAFSAPVQLPLDAGLFDCSASNVITCNTSYSPSVMLTNFGSTTLSSCTINWQVNGGTASNQPWTGSLASGATATVSLPAITLGAGSNLLHFYPSNPNGSADYNSGNNAHDVTVNVPSAPAAAPITEAFAAVTYPPANWIVDNVNGDTYKWARSAAGLNGAGSSKMDFYNSPNGNVDNLDLPMMDLTAAVAGSTLQFDVAYAQYSTENDRLQVRVSGDCGATWTSLYNKAGATLMTAAATTAAFTPTAAQWRHETILLDSYIGMSNLLFQFNATSNFGNNLYVDNINITAAPTGINEPSNLGTIGVYPNPNTGNFHVNVDFNKSENVSITVTNLMGEVVRTFESKNVVSHDYLIDMTTEAKGNYFVTIKTDNGSVTRRISVTQ